jgi:hypothetical protein
VEKGGRREKGRKWRVEKRRERERREGRKGRRRKVRENGRGKCRSSRRTVAISACAEPVTPRLATTSIVALALSLPTTIMPLPASSKAPTRHAAPADPPPKHKKRYLSSFRLMPLSSSLYLADGLASRFSKASRFILSYSLPFDPLTLIIDTSKSAGPSTSHFTSITPSFACLFPRTLLKAEI